ncbi:MAG: hypothetical protein SFW62_09850 [Alphaproteobacteria bacterium]|nr:hypothetical protein [Alphaproteobacteria bacterium]
MIMEEHCGRINWLSSLLGEQRDRIVALTRRISGLGVPGAMKPSVFGKFLHLLDQVAIAKDEEINLIGRIEALEAAHRFRRQCKSLKNMVDALEPTGGHMPKFEDEAEDKPSRVGIWFLAFLFLVSQCKINQKKQSLTVD